MKKSSNILYKLAWTFYLQFLLYKTAWKLSSSVFIKKVKAFYKYWPEYNQIVPFELHQI